MFPSESNQAFPNGNDHNHTRWYYSLNGHLPHSRGLTLCLLHSRRENKSSRPNSRPHQMSWRGSLSVGIGFKNKALCQKIWKIPLNLVTVQWRNQLGRICITLHSCVKKRYKKGAIFDICRKRWQRFPNSMHHPLPSPSQDSSSSGLNMGRFTTAAASS